MRRCVSILLVASALAAQTVSGTVSDGVTRQPLPRVSVSLLRPGANTSGKATTNATGAFRIADVAPGDYFVVVLHPGYEIPDTRSLKVHVDTGSDPAPLDVTLMPWAKLRGRVLDPERQPLAGITVTLIPFSGISMQPAITDKQGRYEFKSVAPGVYALLANPLEAGGSEFAPTYSDQRITVNVGADLAGYDIVLRGGPFFHVSGNVVDESGRAAAGAEVKLATADTTFGTAVADAHGNFEIEHVAAVDGHLFAVWKRGGVELRGFASTAVTRHDVEGITMRLSPPVIVTGTAEVDGETVALGAGLYAQLTPVGGMGIRTTAISSPEGFHFEAYPGRYILFAVPYGAARTYLDSARLGDRDITMQEFEIVPGMLPLRIVLRTGGGRVQAHVDDATPGVVLLIPDEPRLRWDPFVRSAVRDAGARMEFAGVRPGDYYAVALPGGVRKTQLQDPDYLAALVRQGTPVHVEREGTVTVELKLGSAPE